MSKREFWVLSYITKNSEPALIYGTLKGAEHDLRESARPGIIERFAPAEEAQINEIKESMNFILNKLHDAQYQTSASFLRTIIKDVEDDIIGLLSNY